MKIIRSIQNKGQSKLKSLNSNIIYPITLVPNSYIEFLEYPISKNEIIKEFPHLEVKYQYFSEPKSPKKPDNYELISKERYRIPPYLYFLILPITFLFLEIRLCLTPPEGIVSFALIDFALIVFLVYKFIKNIEIQKYKIKQEISTVKYRALLEEYNIEKKNYDEDFKSYQTGKNKYEEEKTNQNTLIKQYYDNYIVKKYKENIVAKIEYKRSIPDNENSVKKGKTELYFFEYLFEIFGNNVKIDCSVNQFSLSYFPDFIIIFNDNKSYIDIEIDEPYDLESKKPIHYLKSDNPRNQFFLDKNYAVIRFTENQVMEYPKECCKYIDDIIKHLLDPFSDFPTSNFKGIKENQWTYEEAIIMARQNQRL